MMVSKRYLLSNLPILGYLSIYLIIRGIRFFSLNGFFFGDLPGPTTRVFPKIGGFSPKMDGENHGKQWKPPIKIHDLRGKKNPYFLDQHPRNATNRPHISHCLEPRFSSSLTMSMPKLGESGNKTASNTWVFPKNKYPQIIQF